MKLKRLELIGFKSFVDKTIVEFDKDVTAVVGPNGCGKSNIVDAIRWVMGEMSAKHLRGRHMQDVIFSGSELRSPISMASVELTFSTEGYQTPAAYLNHSEISISRRLYRTGESEYFINKVPVRLKDVTDLFLGTGVGKKAYSMIEQGRVGQVVSAKPEERRYFIEEAAGISKFKARKEAALRKMDSTRQNLLRLTDLVTEIERQVNSLDRQAKKAEKYRTLKQEFQKLDLAVSSAKYTDLTENQNSLEKDLRELSEKQEGVHGSLQEAENGLEEEKTALVVSEQEINQVQNQLYELNNYIQLLETTLRFKTEEQDRLARQADDIQKTIHEYETEIVGLTNGKNQINEQKLIADFEEEQLEEEVQTLQKRTIDAQAKLATVKSSSEETWEAIRSHESRLTQIDTLRTGHHQKGEELTQSIQELEEELGTLEKIMR